MDTPNDRAVPVQLIALLGVWVVGSWLWNSTKQLFPNVPGPLLAVSPLLPVEMAQSPADFNRILGPPGSHIRVAVIENVKNAGGNFPQIWIFFAWSLAAVMATIRPKLRNAAIILAVTGVVLMLVEFHALDLIRMAALKNTITDETVHQVHVLATARWCLLFATALLGSLMFLGSSREVKPASYLFILSALAGLVGAAVYAPLMLYAVMGIMFAVLGLVVICLFCPSWV